MKYFPLLGFVLFSVIGYGQISKSQTIDWYKSLYLTTALEQMDYVKGTACEPGKIDKVKVAPKVDSEIVETMDTITYFKFTPDSSTYGCTFA